MLQRKARAAANTWYKLGRPLITSGDRAGQHDQERITAQIQVIEDDLGPYGERKVTGFTLAEIAKCAATGQGQTILLNPEDPDSVIVARISVGTGIDQFTVDELHEVIRGMGGVVLSTPSPLDDKDRLRIKLERDLAPKEKGGRPKKNVTLSDTSTDGPAGVGAVDSQDSAARAVSE
jgi:hypothetical protein